MVVDWLLFSFSCLVFILERTFFGELFYVWFLVLFLETFLLLKKKYKWTFLFLLFVIPITLVISYFFGIYYFWAEVFGALFVFTVFFLSLSHFTKYFRKFNSFFLTYIFFFILIYTICQAKYSKSSIIMYIRFYKI